MPAYIIGHISVKDPEIWTEYRGRVPATLSPWGGELLFRGRTAVVFSGDHPYTDTVVIRFPDITAATGWHESAEYQALIPLREEAANVVLIGYEQG